MNGLYQNQTNSSDDPSEFGHNKLFIAGFGENRGFWHSPALIYRIIGSIQFILIIYHNGVSISQWLVVELGPLAFDVSVLFDDRAIDIDAESRTVGNGEFAPAGVERRGENFLLQTERVHARMGFFLENGIFQEF